MSTPDWFCPPEVPFKRTPPEMKKMLFDQALLEQSVAKVFADIQTRKVPWLPGLTTGLGYRYTNLKCPMLEIQPAGWVAVFIQVDVRNDQLLIVFRGKLASTISYQGFWPFSVPLSNIPYVSLCCAVQLTFEHCRQFNLEWKLQKILDLYPEVTSQPWFDTTFQKFGFEQMGYSPVVWKPPYNITLSTGI